VLNNDGAHTSSDRNIRSPNVTFDTKLILNGDDLLIDYTERITCVLKTVSDGTLKQNFKN